MKKELIINDNPKSIVSEDIRTIRTNLEFSSIGKNLQTILLTSSSPHEGKSFIASNLAGAFAKNGKKTLLIDVDLRLGRQHKIFNISNKKGLTNLILNCDRRTNLREYIFETKIENLSMITSGIVPPNPSELLASNNFRLLVNKLKEVFDIIIFDGPPVNGLADSLIVSKIVDRVILVCNYGKTDVNDLLEAKKNLKKVDAKIAGVIINNYPKKSKKYGNYYGVKDGDNKK